MISFGDSLIYVTTFFGLFTSIYFLMTLFEARNRLKFGECVDCPSVSVCIPCFNEESTVEKTLRSLCKLDYDPRKLEIIVVDDGSSDKTYLKALNFAKRNKDHNIRVFKKSNGGKHTAVNYALERSHGEFFGVLDADSFVDKHALKRMMKLFEDKNVMAVTPSMLVHNPKNILQRVQYIEYLMGVFLRKVFAQLGSQHVTPGPFSFFRKTFFEKHGNYHEAHLTEDIEMALRIQKYGGVIENALDAFVFTSGLRSFNSLYKQRLRWYYGFIRNLVDYKELFSRKHGNLGVLVLPASFTSVVLVIIFLFYSLFNILKNLVNKLMNLYAVNFDIFQLRWFDFDGFFVNTNSLAVLGFISLALVIIIIVIAKRLSQEKKSISFSYVLFMLTYWILFGFWWLASIFAVFFRRGKVKWGHKSGEL